MADYPFTLAVVRAIMEIYEPVRLMARRSLEMITPLKIHK